MPRHYDLSFRLRRDVTEDRRKRMVMRKRDGLFTAALKTKPGKVDDSLDAKFGKKISRPKYDPLSTPSFYGLLFLLIFPGIAKAENPQLNSAIQNVSTQTTALQNVVRGLSQDETTLIAKYHLTNSGQCNLWIVGVTTTSTIPISYLATSAVTALQADLLFSSSFTVTGGTIGPAGTTAGKGVQISVIPGGERVIVFGLNQVPIGSGLLATLSFSSLANTPKGNYPITVQSLAASDANGNASLLCGTSGYIKR